MLRVVRVQLKNVRCFRKLDVELPRSGGGWSMFVGDNATGKSALLRSIAMGLCDEASAAGLLKESDEGYIRRGCHSATITIHLRDDENPRRDFMIHTEIRRSWKGKKTIFRDLVRQRTSPGRKDFPWNQLFVSGYGAGRGVSGAGDISSYSVIDAVYNMFNYLEGLQNPELTIRRLRDRRHGKAIEKRSILTALAQFSQVENVRLTTQGVLVDGPWGKGMPLRDLADGYRAAFIWVADLIGWALTFKPSLRGTQGIRGIVLIDEIEEHLHARWQRRAIGDLRQLFPNVQFIATTHSPLIAASIGEPKLAQSKDALFVLEGVSKGGVTAASHEFMIGWSMDQVLASRAFKYQMPTSSEYDEALRVASALLYKRHRTDQEKNVLQSITERVQNARLIGISPAERKAETIEETRVVDQIAELEKKLFPDEQT
jgi:hypothetical protein